MDDERQVEMDCISAIFPEMIIDPDNPFSASIELPVNPSTAVKVVFLTVAQGLTPLPTPPPSGASDQEGQAALQPAHNVESHNLSHLPPLQLHINLPEGYPADRAPTFELATTPAWLSRAYLDELQDNGRLLWEEGGRTEVVYGYIDSLQQAAENAFGHADGEALVLSRELKIALLDHDIKATQAAFDKETFDCGVCLDPKKGSACHRMLDCGHVFCVQCLQDFYNNAITEGDIISVRCLAPGCAKDSDAARLSKGQKPKSQLSPSELLQIPLEHEMVTRYVRLKHKAVLESDKNTIYCPRKWCQGAARSKKHRKPDGFEVVESEDEGDAESDHERKGKFRAGNDLLCVCEDCSFAFCSRCYQGWHGEFTHCIPMTKNGELTEEDKASLEYLKAHTTPCPTCAAPAQKTHGCNHMICFTCKTHFCYLCSAWLEPNNPYNHFNKQNTGCYMRLWEREGGDGDNADIVFAGNDDMWLGVPNEEIDPDFEAVIDEPEPNVPEAANAVNIPDEVAVVEQPADQPPALPAAPQIPQPAPAIPNQPAVAQELHREGPLVLRINAQPRPAPVPAIPDPQPAQRARGPRRGNPNRRIDPPPRLAGGGGGGGGRGRLPRAPERRGGGREEAAEAHQQWVQMFVQMALNDEEDMVEWDSDEEDAAAWEIPVQGGW